MKLPVPSTLTIIRLVSMIVFGVSAFFLDSRYSIVTFLAFVVFFACSLVQLRRTT